LKNGVIAKAVHKSILKLTPPLVLNKEEVNKISEIFLKSWGEVEEIK
jgi:4-aminobutyrate aminotransferase-like enzyme